MRKSLILMLLMAGIFVSLSVFISAQITGDAVNNLPDGASCSSDNECGSGWCHHIVQKDGSVKGVCGQAGFSACYSNSDCAAGQTCSGAYQGPSGTLAGQCIGAARPGETVTTNKTNVTRPGPAFTRVQFPGKGWDAIEAADGSTCYVKGRAEKKAGVRKSIFEKRSVSGRVVVTGDFTEESCNTACGIEGGMISYSGDKSCECNAKEVFRMGNKYCVNYNNKDVCGSLGQRMTTNDGMKVMMTKNKMGMSSSMIEVEIVEPIQQIPKNSGYYRA